MRTSIRATLLVLASCLLVGACDPAATSGQDQKADDKAKTGEAAKDGDAKAGDKAEAAKTGEAPPAEAAPAEPAAPETLDGCLTECEQAILSEDDRATCRLRCKNTHGAASQKHPTIGTYLGCADECLGKSADDRPTCFKNCAASVTAGGGDPNASACPRTCLESFGTCLSPCVGKNEDDAATCRKLCEVNATKCVDECAAPAAE